MFLLKSTLKVELLEITLFLFNFFPCQIQLKIPVYISGIRKSIIKFLIISMSNKTKEKLQRRDGMRREKNEIFMCDAATQEKYHQKLSIK